MRRFGVAVVAASLWSGVAYAQGTGQDVATAQALFDEGKRLMAANKFAEACPKLVESQRLDPGGGTLYAIALCHEGEGRTATAWADYGVAAAEARRDNRKDREQAANDKVRALEPKLTKMRVVVADKAAGLELKRDGALVGEAQWGLALPIDPGPHAFSATAPGKTSWNSTVDIKGEGKTVDVAVPRLDDAAPTPYDQPPPVVAPPPVNPVQQQQPVVQAPPPAEPSMQKTWAVVAGGAGVVAVGVGLGFGAAASSKWNDAKSKCPNDRCTVQSDTTLGNDAGRAADIATVLVAAGSGAILAGVILWLTAPKSDQHAVRIAPTFARDTLGLSVGGRL
jgi:serine/threonine-protein kinase